MTVWQTEFSLAARPKGIHIVQSEVNKALAPALNGVKVRHPRQLTDARFSRLTAAAVWPLHALHQAHELRFDAQ